MGTVDAIHQFPVCQMGTLEHRPAGWKWEVTTSLTGEDTVRQVIRDRHGNVLAGRTLELMPSTERVERIVYDDESLSDLCNGHTYLWDPANTTPGYDGYVAYRVV